MPNLTLMEWAKRLDPSGRTAAVANLLAQTNRIMDDAVYQEGNLPTGHRVTIATGLPTIYYRALNQGVPTSKATTAQVDEAMAIMEAYSEVDIDLASLNGNVNQFRASEAMMFLEAMNQKAAQTLFYGNPASDPKEYLGLAPRYSSLSAGNAQNIISGGGSTANAQTSIWLIAWSDQTVFKIFPKGSRAGIIHEDLGRQTSDDTGTTGQRMEVYRERFQIKCGLVVRDWRYAVRICNLDVAELQALSGNQAPSAASAVTTNLLHLLTQAAGKLPSNMGRPAWYCNRTAFTALQRLGLETSGVRSGFKVDEAASQFGRPNVEQSFQGIPIRQCDQLLNTEAVVS